MNIQDETAEFMRSKDCGPSHPRCAVCQVPMWLVIVERRGDTERKRFECKACGAKTLE